MAVDGLEEQHNAKRDPRSLKVKAHLIAMLFAQLAGSRSLRDIETNLKSHAGKLYHLGGSTISKSSLLGISFRPITSPIFSSTIPPRAGSTAVSAPPNHHQTNRKMTC